MITLSQDSIGVRGEATREGLGAGRKWEVWGRLVMESTCPLDLLRRRVEEAGSAGAKKNLATVEEYRKDREFTDTRKKSSRIPTEKHRENQGILHLILT